ncbi:hypothetical protein BAUCODRAFT_426733 [Baudoinia panamericana UAMH 10762]|uniref:Uncharacterized protein n=1 Tax=Baudoinia panamericana (strain UAMH 10762) TaxID=717646 RepID=M2N3C4_BAUPA|nr:uncharacterized protein BAUCODRAFT_426733 [Baudoinia panamericana UAMH 10762]EMC98458.1 hypothetical protein BAUCODRAFT_426733 [Baudoinia panamericana UAMH 10762]
MSQKFTELAGLYAEQSSARATGLLTLPITRLRSRGYSLYPLVLVEMPTNRRLPGDHAPY